jgi:hypothetical protein
MCFLLTPEISQNDVCSGTSVALMVGFSHALSNAKVRTQAIVSQRDFRE